jgi:hypothetical protein
MGTDIVFLLDTLRVEKVLGDILIQHTHRIVDLNVEMCHDDIDRVLSFGDYFAYE